MALEGRAPWEARARYNSAGQLTELELPGGVVSRFQYDKAGRVEWHTVSSGGRETRRVSYAWGARGRLMKARDELKREDTEFSYGAGGALTGALEKANTLYPKRVNRAVDAAGNIYRWGDRRDRIYGAGGRLEKSGIDARELRYYSGRMENGVSYGYGAEGELVEKNDYKSGEVWKYGYYGNGALSKVVLPGGGEVTFKYDPLGRRIEKRSAEKAVRYIWDGDNLLHEVEGANITTWAFIDGFAPVAKVTEGGCYGVITDYMGAPVEAYDEAGGRVWAAGLDIYGEAEVYVGEAGFAPFRYQGQYHDTETGLYYNRFRYYDPKMGQYTQRDPIGPAGGNPTLYAYVRDPNSEVDPYGLFIKEIWGAGKKAAGFVIEGAKKLAVTAAAIKYAEVKSLINAGKNALNYARAATRKIISR